jgi:hypothetical protein
VAHHPSTQTVRSGPEVKDGVASQAHDVQSQAGAFERGVKHFTARQHHRIKAASGRQTARIITNLTSGMNIIGGQHGNLQKVPNGSFSTIWVIWR